MRAFGIDLGTTYSSIALCHDRNRLDVYRNKSNATDIPSIAHYEGGKFSIGTAAEAYLIRDPESTIFDTKRMIGRPVGDKGIEEARSRWPFKVESNAEGNPVIVIPSGPKIEPYKVSGEILKHLADIANSHLEKPISDCVVTVPANFTNAQKEDTLKAAKYAGLKVLELVPEPTAAAIAFGILSTEQSTGTSETILVFDFGGGTLDVSVLQRRGEHFDVKAVAGDTMLGGRDIDDCLLDYIIKREHLESVQTQPRTIGRIRKAVVEAKIQLSDSGDKGLVLVENVDGNNDLDCWITRVQFDNACRRVFDRITYPVQEALELAGIDKGKVDKILLVGGSSRIPKVKEVIESFFLGKRAFHGVDPSQAVVRGAAFYAGKLCGCPGLASFSVTNVCPLSLGVESGGVMSFVIPRGTAYGSTKTVSYVTSLNYQESVYLRVYEGERPQPKHSVSRPFYCIGPP